MEKESYEVNSDPEAHQLPSYANDRKGSVLGEAVDLYGNVQTAEHVIPTFDAYHLLFANLIRSSLVWICRARPEKQAHPVHRPWRNDWHRSLS